MSEHAVPPRNGRIVSSLRRAIAVSACLLSLAFCLPPPASGQNAPGAPGAKSAWASANKDFLGTSVSPTSHVHFTGAEGIVTEVFWPGPDTVQYVDLQFLVTDGARSWLDEEKRQQRTVSPVDDHALAWRVVTENPGHGLRIEKTIFPDPDRPALLRRVVFTVTAPGRIVADYALYVLGNPAINNSGGGQGGGTQD